MVIKFSDTNYNIRCSDLNIHSVQKILVKLNKDIIFILDIFQGGGKEHQNGDLFIVEITFIVFLQLNAQDVLWQLKEQ